MVSREIDSDMASFHNVKVRVDPRRLLSILGKDYLGDDYKVTREWNCLVDGEIFCIFDWKQTSSWDPDLPDPNDFWKQDLVELCIASRLGPLEDQRFAEYLSFLCQGGAVFEQ